MPSGELNVTLAALTLSSGAEQSGNIVYAVLGDATLASAGVVLVYGSLNSTLANATLAGDVKIEASASLGATLENVKVETFSAIFGGTKAPYEDVLSWTGHPLTGSRVRVRTGNLYGIFGESNEFGLFAGDGWDESSGAPPLSSSKYIRLGSFTNEFHNVPIRLYDDGAITMQMEPDDPSFAMGSPIPTAYDTGIGLWQGKDSDDVYKWRVGDPDGASLNWDGTGLSINNGSLDISGATSHIAFGNPPPTSSTSGTGIWIDRTGLYGVNDGVTQIFIDTLDGILYVDGGTEFGVNPLLGDLYVDGVLTLGADGRMQQGTGTWGVDFTGSAIWNDSGVMNIGGWSDNVKQWWGGSDGDFYASSGNLKIDSSGITFKNSQDGLLFYSGNTAIGSLTSNINVDEDFEIILSTGTPDSNFIRNGDFSTDDLSSWTIQPSITTSEYHSSPACGYAPVLHSPFTLMETLIRVSENEDYTLSFWQKVVVITGYVGVYLVIEELDENKTWIRNSASGGILHFWNSGSSDWTDFSFTITTGEDTNYLRFKWVSQEWASGGHKEYYIDDISFTAYEPDKNTKIILGMDDINYHANTGDYYTNPGIHIFHGDTNIKDNLVVEGTIKDGSGVEYLKTTGKAADSDKLDGLDSTDFGRPVFLATQLTSTSWDGDSFSTTGKTLIDLSAVFGVPAGVKAVLVKVALRDSGSAAASCVFQLSGVSSGTNYSLTAQASPINDRYAYYSGIVPCNANGDVYYMTTASGSATMDIYLEIWGYWL